ncbi:hypothetical protein H9L15_07735 [Sphingomonas daechungensis]|uniref:Uncharacterized protein n=1 Tax=Sphingomonas daechungensis TaxID=1176646 RepID=A0ABX6T0K3_9SPHN|nr:hypothetical protein H9L15_07735 [Sphingomonas daechungensis]
MSRNLSSVASAAANEFDVVRGPAAAQAKPVSRLSAIAGQILDVLNPSTPGKAEMRNCDAKRAAMLKDQAHR